MVLMTRLVPSLPALVTPVWRKARISGDQVDEVVARRWSSAGPESADGVEPGEPVGDEGAVGAGACEREQVE